MTLTGADTCGRTETIYFSITCCDLEHGEFVIRIAFVPREIKVKEAREEGN